MSLTREKLEAHIRKYEVRGRETFAVTGQAAVGNLVDKLMEQLDTNKDGSIGWSEFSEGNRNNSFESLLDQDQVLEQ